MTSTAKSQRQAYPLALALYRRGMLVIDLGIWIDGSDGPKPTHAMRYRDSRTGTPSAGKFAQRAYREAGVCEHTPPGPDHDLYIP